MTQDRKRLLYGVMIATFVPVIILPLIFLTNGFFILPDDIIVVIGTWLGLFSFLFIFWQYVLGVRTFTKFFTEDFITVNKLHQTLGIYGFFLIIFHPTLIIIGYFFEMGQLLINLNFNTTLDIAVKIGELAITIIIFNWLISYLFRNRFSFRWWKRIHLLNYLILPLAYFHSNLIGTFLQDPLLNFYFKILAIIFTFIFLYRLGKQFGFFRYKYTVSKIQQITHDVIQVSFAPVKDSAFINPREGQFIEIQTSKWGETHPFTASEYNPKTHEVSISPKNSGPFSSKLFNLKIGDLVYLDGPYGVFTKEAYKLNSKKVVLIVGGIGITPFLRFFDHFEKNHTLYDEVVLFYGNKTPDDIAYKERIARLQHLPNFMVINALSEDTRNIPEYVKGYVSVDLMKQYLKDELDQYKFFLCGPPPMMKKVTDDLKANGVVKSRIYREKFSF